MFRGFVFVALLCHFGLSLFAQNVATKVLGEDEERQLFILLDKKDLDGTRHLLETLKKQDFDISFALGVIHGRGDDFYNREDYSSAIPYYQLCSDFTDPACEVDLGYMYNNGKGVILSFAKAQQLFEKAVAQGSSDGFYNLADMIDNHHATGSYTMKDAIELYRKAVAAGPGGMGGRRSANRLKTLGMLTLEEREVSEETAFEWDASVPDSLRTAASLKLNGIDVSATKVSQSSVSFLGGGPKQGLNIIESAQTKLYLWREEHKLSVFARPYNNSFAVLVAIDDYDRKRDPQKR